MVTSGGIIGYERAYGNRARTVRKAIADLFLLIYGLRCGSYGIKYYFRDWKL